ncbi:MAG: aspartate carbamoyltransferase [Promethearchaeota archaeon]
MPEASPHVGEELAGLKLNFFNPGGEEKLMEFTGRHVLSAKDFTREEIEALLEAGTRVKNKHPGEVLRGKILATLFFEPSTRTRLSFESAMLRLGGSVLGFHSSEVSSIKKGETLADTIRTVNNYADVIVMRHGSEGAAQLAAMFSQIPVINAGSGSGEHPTQALLDLLCIKNELGTIDGLNIALLGDLRYGRTVHSLAYLLSNFDVNVYFVSPESLRMTFRVVDELRSRQFRRPGVKFQFKETAKFKRLLPILDVLYVTRIQRERFTDPEEYELVRGVYVFRKEDLADTKDKFILMHPLPRIDEIAPDVDDSPKAMYFKQTRYGLWMRMALLSLILGARV